MQFYNLVIFKTIKGLVWLINKQYCIVLTGYWDACFIDGLLQHSAQNSVKTITAHLY